MSPEAAVRQAVLDTAAAYEACLEKPAACDPATIYYPDSVALASMRKTLRTLVDKGAYASSDPNGSRLVVESISFDSATQARATLCIYDAGAILGPPGTDGTPTVVNGDIVSVRVVDIFLFNGSQWRESQALPREILGRTDLCPSGK